jgi:hypothetical protein
MKRRLSMVLLLALIAPSLQAGVEARATASSWVQFGNLAPQHAADPADRPFHIVEGFSVMAAVNNFTSGLDAQGNVVGSAANASIGMFVGEPFADLLTSGYAGTSNQILAGSFLHIDGSVVGEAGKTGRIDLSGAFVAGLQFLGVQGPGAEADLSYHLVLALSGPGQSACPQQRCERRIDYQLGLDGGDTVLGGVFGGNYDLALDASAGDRIEIFIGFGARLSNGYWVVARPANMPAEAQSFSAGAGAGAGGVLSSLRLGNGLGLSADTGLTQRPDGSWGLPVSAVPEAPAWALLGSGLLALVIRRKSLSDKA